jgi:hypothetical protein
MRRPGNVAGHQDRIFYRTQGSYRAQPSARVHDCRIHFDGDAIEAQGRAGPGVKPPIVFHAYDRGDGGSQSVLALREPGCPRFGCLLTSICQFLTGPGAAMHHDCCCQALLLHRIAPVCVRGDHHQ